MGCESSVMEDPDNEYDSTWDGEDEEQQFRMMKVNERQARTAQRNLEAARDMQNFRHRCRNTRYAYRSHGQADHLYNLNFYQNKDPFLPDGVRIEEIHERWLGDYTRLERVHSYIQWLFPTQEPGVNYSAHVLTPTEIKHFHEDRTVRRRLLKSYKLMLDFYGIRLLSDKTGEVQRADNWKERFENLNRNLHNNLRITRILKCLGLLGFHRYQAPLVRFFLTETLVNGTLPQVKQSVLDYFIFAVLDTSERKQLIKYAFHYFEPKQLFVWCPRRIQRKLMRQIAQKGHRSRTPAGARKEVRHYKPDYRESWKVELARSQNRRVRNTSRRQIDPRNSRTSARNYTLV